MTGRIETEEEIRAAVAEWSARGPWEARHAASFEANLREIVAEPLFPEVPAEYLISTPEFPIDFAPSYDEGGAADDERLWRFPE